MQVLAYLRSFNLVSVLLRLCLAVLAGGVIGYGRSARQRAAGFRTYTLICIGAALSVIISLYEYEMFMGYWHDIVLRVGEKFDVSRLAAQTLSGIGFLGAGIIFKIAHQQVSGLTTATGLFATVALGIAAGAGFFECVIIAVVLIHLVLNVMTPLESQFKRLTRNITLFVEFEDIDDLAEVAREIEAQDAQIFDIDIERTDHDAEGNPPSAVFVIKLSRANHSHSGMLSSVAELPCVRSVEELIS
jgi:putative Mg2+ transporter-C (MgtC) family protein